MRANPSHKGVSSLTAGSLPHGAVALIYVRQSRHKDYERTVSPEDQEAQCRALVAVEACEVVEVYKDLDLSGGSTRKRAGLAALLDRVRAGGVSVIAALDQSRAFRNVADALAFYALMERHPDIRVEYVKGRFDRSAVGGFTYTTLAAAHELERRMTGEKIRDAWRYRIAHGEMVGPLPLGFRRADDRAVVLDETWAPVVRRMFEDYAAGAVSTRQLAERLNTEGVRPPKFVTGWRADTVAQILRHPAYVAMTRLDGRYGKSDPVPATWPAVVDRETWDAVQALVDRRFAIRGRRPKMPYAFGGLLRCSCGAKMHAHNAHGIRRYECRRTGALVGGCGNAVRDDALEPWGRSLMEWLEGAHGRPDLAAAVHSLTGRSKGRAPDAVAQIDSTLARVGQRFEWGDIGADEYRERRERLLALRSEALAETRPAPRLPLTGLVAAWDTNDHALRNRLLVNLFDEIDVRDGRVDGARPRAAVASEVSQYLEGWPGLDGGTLRLRFA